MTSPRKLPPPLPTIGILTKPVRLRWNIDNLLSSDGHQIAIVFSCTARAIDEPAERQLFNETFSPSAKSAGPTVIDHFLTFLRGAGAELARHETAEELLGIPARARWVSALRSAANETAFSCGIEVQAPFDVEVTSPTLQKERLEQMQRIAAERRSVDRAGHFARAAELLKQWESLKADIPSVTPGKLLDQINPADRGLMLDTLLMAGSSATRAQGSSDLWAVSGSYLVRMDVRGESPATELISLPITIGPLRSIRGAGGKFLVGARNGAFIVDPADPAKAVVYRYPKLNSEYGFTSVTQTAGHLWACHREGGLIGWDLDRPTEPAMVFSPAGLGGEPRHLSTQRYFCAGCKLFQLSTTGPIATAFTAGAPIVGVLPADHQLIVVDGAGSIAILDGHVLEKTSELAVSGRISSAALLPWLSSSRLLLNRTDGPIECIGLEDQLITRFGANHAGMRAITANTGKVAAMSNDRQRVLLWNTWDGRAPWAEIYLAGQTHHRIADLTFA